MRSNRPAYILARRKDGATTYTQHLNHSYQPIIWDQEEDAQAVAQIVNAGQQSNQNYVEVMPYKTAIETFA
jgi:hypothetical protein